MTFKFFTYYGTKFYGNDLMTLSNENLRGVPSDLYLNAMG
jgi:hypothetical protein